MGAIPRNELIRRFRVSGFGGPFPGKRHPFMKRGALKVRIPNPHGSGDIDTSLVARILKSAGIDQDEWNRA